MIDLPEIIVTKIAEQVALANTASFLWRKLTGSPTVTYLSKTESSVNLIESLKELLANAPLTEAGQTAAYIFLVALLLQNRENAIYLVTLPGIDALYWFKSLSKYVSRAHYGTSVIPMSQGLLQGNNGETTSSSTDVVLKF